VLAKEPAFSITTPHLTLRYFQPDDAEAMLSVYGDPEVMRFGAGVQTIAWVRAWLRDCLDHDYPTRGFGAYAVVQNAQNTLIGYCGLFSFPDVAGQPEIEIGYRLARILGKGLRHGSSPRCARFCFLRIKNQTFIALIDPANLASIGVARKLGMHYEKEVMLPGYSHPDHLYVVSSL